MALETRPENTLYVFLKACLPWMAVVGKSCKTTSYFKRVMFYFALAEFRFLLRS